MLLEIAVGDALGAGYEYNNAALDKHRGNLFHGYIQHGKHTGIKPGMYTDDTQMSIAIAEAIVSGDPWKPGYITQHFLNAFLRDKRDGYARGFQAFLEDPKHHDPDGFLDDIRPDSDKSGAAMRAGCIGFVPNMGRVIEMATVQAEITHATKGGVDSAVAAALMVYFLRHTGEPKAQLPGFLATRVKGYPWDTYKWVGKVGVKGIECVHAALTAIMDNDSLTGVLNQCIEYTGDVDTVAAIAMAAACQSNEIKQDIPQNLIDTLENGAYGRDYIVALDEKLRLASAQ